MIALIAFCAVLAVGIGVFLWIYSRDDGLIFDNVYALGIDLSGMTQEEAARMPLAELEYRKTQVRRRMLEAGAHYVVDTIAELPDVIADINKKLTKV